MASASFHPGLNLYQEQPIPHQLKESLPLLSTPGLRREELRSVVLALRPYERDAFFKSRSGLDGYKQFLRSVAMRRVPLPADVADICGDSSLFSSDIDEHWRKHQDMLQSLMSGSEEYMEDYLNSFIIPEYARFQDIPANVHPELINFQLSDSVAAKKHPLHTTWGSYNQETVPGLIHNFSTISAHPDGRFALVDTVTDMRDLGSVFDEFAVSNDSTRWSKQSVLVPHFQWNDVLDLQDHTHSSSLMLESMTASPLKSPKKIRMKPAPKRKTKKMAVERDLYRNNSLHAIETILSLIVDKKRNGKSMMNSLRKSGPELPQFLTQFSASIAGTGLAVMFSVLYKVACGSAPFCTSNVLTSVFGVGLFWLSGTVNRLRNTVLCISKNFSKLGFEEEEMMMKVDKSVNDMVFRAAALMGVLVLRFA